MSPAQPPSRQALFQIGDLLAAPSVFVVSLWPSPESFVRSWVSWRLTRIPRAFRPARPCPLSDLCSAFFWLWGTFSFLFRGLSLIFSIDFLDDHGQPNASIGCIHRPEVGLDSLSVRSASAAGR